MSDILVTQEVVTMKLYGVTSDDKVSIMATFEFSVSVDWVLMGLGNGLSPVRCQAITKAGAYLIP